MVDLLVPDQVAERAANNGAAGRRWLDSLPAVVAELAGRWRLTLGAPFAGGTSGYVVAARTEPRRARHAGRVEHDLAVLMREYNDPLAAGDTSRLVRERAEFLAARCGVDATAVWEWGFVERVSTGLANLRDFDDGSGAVFLEVARRCC